METQMKQKSKEEYVQIDEVEWQAFPTAFSAGGIQWKLLHVSPENSSWTAIFDCPAGSSFAPHIHAGPGEYFLTKGKMDVRGGKAEGGDTAIAPGYGYESSGARHDKTQFPIDSEFYMTFLGPLTFINPDGSPIAVIGWEEAQGAWAA
ncbi:MAG: acetylacetone-cleaving protein [Betaproteobacteria bacterium]|jgi:anti-sigma factor ChrR (cupin superfamily)|nr:acetylacetone-cleaving protein [Betaproteobacteria bacterium]NBY16102.1 acetylacetone-cleaving protein [Betaproteobacteria bacterium]